MFFIITKHNIKIPKNQPLRVYVSIRQVTNKLASKSFVVLLWVAINASGSPFSGLSHRRNKKIKIVEIRIYNIHQHSTIIPKQSNTPSFASTNGGTVNRINTVNVKAVCNEGKI
jgi:hypothetical protein